MEHFLYITHLILTAVLIRQIFSATLTMRMPMLGNLASVTELGSELRTSML